MEYEIKKVYVRVKYNNNHYELKFKNELPEDEDIEDALESITQGDEEEYCPNCEMKLEPYWIYCAYCGVEL